VKVITTSTVEPQLTLDTMGGNFETGEDAAHDYWIEHCEGSTADEVALAMAQSIMENFVQLPREDATEYTFGVIRGLLRKSRKPEGTPGNLEGASQ